MLIFVRPQIIQGNTLCHVHISSYLIAYGFCKDPLPLAAGTCATSTHCKENRELMAGLTLTWKKGLASEHVCTKEIEGVFKNAHTHTDAC